MSLDVTTAASDPIRSRPDDDVTELALAIAWSVYDPRRVGQVAFVSGRERWVFGRGGNLHWLIHRPQTRTPARPLDDPKLSREQLVLQGVGRGVVRLTSVGRLPVRVDGALVEERDIGEGATIEVGDRFVLVVHRRPLELEGERPKHAFGGADAQGFVGEGPATWALRTNVAFLARRAAHVLVCGASGTGKELAARALHQLSLRASGPLVSRSAATIPESLADAELFGNLGNYPNPGMAARPGLVGEADGGTLFLDEFGELPIELQARLLRVLDAGEYTRLGEARPRHANLRLLAATNRDPEELKHDVLARLPLRLNLAPLTERREDVALIAVHLLQGIARTDPEVARWLDPETGLPRLTTRLVAALAAHPYHTHVRELGALLWRAIGECRGEELDLFPGYGELLVKASATSHAAPERDPGELSPDVIQACLDRHGGSQELAWRELGLSSRYVLARLVKRHGLKVKGRR
ncbi:MAG: sigma-54-dependent Fis family transcriptional regulator [Alphaproteobacteria bacterium]|nr:sigma-54-dependent Fis family transcriptional regulator [Alphaproteobacteria bacterium]MCB9698653.1 sigma-54-dependent Fis family transcriptional regulator [Alphaproteobacteria bacterium]